MIPRILLLFSIFSMASAVTIEQLTWQPELVTKESILKNYLKLTNETIFEEMTTLAFVTIWNPRGFYLARKRVNRLSYVSNVWFEVEPTFGMDVMSDVAIVGIKNIDRDFIKFLRKNNPNIKIVPRFMFTKFTEEVADYFIRTEHIVQRVAQTLANFCHRNGFDGLVIDSYSTFGESLMKHRRDTMETFEQMGNMIRRNRLIAILSLPSPVGNEYFLGDENQESTLINSNECESLLNSYDYFQMWTYIDGLHTRNFIHDKYLLANMELCKFSPKIMLGMSLYGLEYELEDYLEGPRLRDWTTIDSKRFLQVLKLEDSVLTWNKKNKEHELTSKANNTFILFPSLTTLEYRLALAKEHGVAVAFWDYGQGLDYLTNLI
ncbi:hypothetical protein GCK72_018998 [Caenorhabditis remanei]|uniref:GH18 domain-containing protein n=1 Tax=Caenorhabditis remanei TaxID=31234 RepID=A0A6A5GCP4_CAERE|nr:hypothetical protein GCK72_018998 [Caenorhabditis remanei]KAF1752443.1 hypothetical protein GCK72_018998 [Caenorhabditis remanei]